MAREVLEAARSTDSIMSSRRRLVDFDARGRIVAALAVGFSIAGCRAGDAPPTEPSVITYTFSFGSSVQSFQPWTFWLEDAKEGVTNQIAVAVIADFEQACQVNTVRGTLMFDPNVLQTVNYSVGPYMRQGGVATDASVMSGRQFVTFQIDRPDSADGVTGRGTVITIRFRAAGTYSRGSSSQLQWSDTHAYTASFVECLHAARNADVSVR
jgi:hypothetical protein